MSSQSAHDPESSEEDVSKRAIDAALVKTLWAYFRPQRALVFLSCSLLLVLSVTQLITPVLIKNTLDDVIPERDTTALNSMAFLIVSVYVIEFFVRYFQSYSLEKTGQNVVRSLRQDLFARLQALPPSFFDTQPVGRLMTRVTSDVEALNEAFTSGLVLILADLVRLFAIVGILLYFDYRLALITFAILPPMIASTAYFRGKIRDAYRKVRKVIAKLNAFLQENVQGMSVVQLFRREKEHYSEFEAMNRSHCESELIVVQRETYFSAVTEFMAMVTLAFILWAGAQYVGAGTLSVGTLVLFTLLAGKFFQPVQELAQRYSVMQAAMAASERILELLRTEPTIVSPENPVIVDKTKSRGEISFDGVTFGYDPKTPVLRDISFTVSPGERVAIVGWTGAGKTTLVKLITRLYDVTSGRLLVDGHDVRSFDLSSLRRNIGVVLQDQFLFSGSVAENISLGDPSISREDIIEAARNVQVHDFIESLPQGYDTEVKERGGNFSSGERQLISFARALAKRPAILILDEATASVDPATEAKITDAIETLFAGRTSLIIAHRLSTIETVDRVLVFHHGALVEDGPPARLLQKPDGVFRNLHETHFKIAK